MFDNVGTQTVADVVGARTNLPSRTVATYACTTGYAKKAGVAEQMECKYTNKRSFELMGDCNCGTGDFACNPVRCDAISPGTFGGMKFDADGDGVNDYYKMVDNDGNSYDMYFLSRKSPYNAYNTLPRRGSSAWTDAT